MKILVLTTWNNKIKELYAYKFLKTYAWPFDLKIYNEDDGMYEQIPDLFKFIKKFKHLNVSSSINDGSRPGQDSAGISKDVLRFSYKVFAYTNEIIKNHEKYDAIMFIDADSEFLNKIDNNWVKENIYKDDCMLTYLGRSFFTETGFILFNCKHANILNFAIELKTFYTEGLIFKEEYFHDCWAFDKIRKKYEKKFNTKNYNIGDTYIKQKLIIFFHKFFSFLKIIDIIRQKEYLRKIFLLNSVMERSILSNYLIHNKGNKESILKKIEAK